MKIERKTVGSVEVLAPLEPLVDAGAEALAKMLQSMTDGVNPRFVISMNDVGYLDSAALECLVDTSERLSERSLQLKLASVNPTCREILELTGLSGRFQIFDGIEAAVRSFR
jgi:anti-anti-sigma factor